MTVTILSRAAVMPKKSSSISTIKSKKKILLVPRMISILRIQQPIILQLAKETTPLLIVMISHFHARLSPPQERVFKRKLRKSKWKVKSQLRRYSL